MASEQAKKKSKGGVESEIVGERMVFRTLIRGPIEKVWRELTKTGEVQVAMFNAVMHRAGDAPGDGVAMRTPDGKYTSVVGEVVEFDPPCRFAQTFRFTNLDDAPCRVIYDLEEADGGTRFTLTVEGAPVGTKTHKQMSQGGVWICQVLKSVVETGRAPGWYRAMGVVFKVIGPLMMPKRTRSEHWPVARAGVGSSRTDTTKGA